MVNNEISLCAVYARFSNVQDLCRYNFGFKKFGSVGKTCCVSVYFSNAIYIELVMVAEKNALTNA